MRVVFMGTPEFSIPALKTLIAEVQVVAVYSQPDKPVGRGLQMQVSPVKRVALEQGISVFTPEKISLPEEVERLKSFEADFFVIVAYGQILKLPVIQAPKYGCINIHSSLLPRWRGAAPIQWSILSGDEESGVTTMLIVPKLDAGDILLQEKTKITPDDTASSLHDRLAEMGGRLILPTLKGIMEGSLKPKPQDETQVTYAHKLTKDMENVDGTQSARDVDLQVRALNPWPGIRIETESGLKLKIKKGKFVNDSFQADSGVLNEHYGSLVIQCRNGLYQVTELQEEGKKAIAAPDFVNGLRGRGIAFPLKLKKFGEERA